MILVTSANATTGKEVIRQLREQGQPVRAIARDLAKAAVWQEQGVEIVAGDLARPETLDAAMQGVEKVFMVATGDPQIVEWHKNMVAAAKKAGVQHIVKLSSLGAGPDSPVQAGRWHGESQQVIEESGIAFTHLQPNSFMQNLITNSAQTIAQQGVFYSPRGQGRVSMVDVRDIAAVAVAALTQPGHAGKTYGLTGPAALSLYEAADQLSSVLGKKISYIELPFDNFREAMIGYGMAQWLADDLTDLERLFSQGGGEYVLNDIEKVTGKPAHTFAQFAQDYAAAFQA